MRIYRPHTQSGMYSMRHSLNFRREDFAGMRGLSSSRLPEDPYIGCSRYSGSCMIATKGILPERKVVSEFSDDALNRRTLPGIAARKGGSSSPPLRINWAVTEPPPALPPQIVTYRMSVTSGPGIAPQHFTHLAWIAAESRYMPLHPIESRPLVKQRSIGRPIFGDGIACQKSVRSQSILNRYKDYTSIRRADKVGATSISSIADSVPTAVDPQQYWQVLTFRIRWSKYVKDQTIFARR
jgi:hypothetical protein